MGKPKSRARRPGAIGPDRLSKYARKCQDRETAPSAPKVKPAQVLTATLVTPPRAPITTPADAVTVQARFIGVGKPAQTADGENLYLSMALLRHQPKPLKYNCLIECRVIPADPGKKFRRIIALKPIA